MNAQFVFILLEKKMISLDVKIHIQKKEDLTITDMTFEIGDGKFPSKIYITFKSHGITQVYVQQYK